MFAKLKSSAWKLKKTSSYSDIILKYSDILFWGLQVKLTCKDILHEKLGLVHHLFQLVIQSPYVDKRFAAHNNGDQKYKLWLYRQSLA